jgi:hypothetical protein
MDSIIKFVGVFLWTMVLITGAYSYTRSNYSAPETLKGLCDNRSPQELSDLQLYDLLRGLNEFRLSPDNQGGSKMSNDLKWVEPCVGLVMMETKSRRFEKKLTPPRIESINK